MAEQLQDAPVPDDTPSTPAPITQQYFVFWTTKIDDCGRMGGGRQIFDTSTEVAQYLRVLFDQRQLHNDSRRMDEDDNGDNWIDKVHVILGSRVPISRGPLRQLLTRDGPVPIDPVPDVDLAPDLTLE